MKLFKSWFKAMFLVGVVAGVIILCGYDPMKVIGWSSIFAGFIFPGILMVRGGGEFNRSSVSSFIREEAD